jgi:hypothetical protein
MPAPQPPLSDQSAITIELDVSKLFYDIFTDVANCLEGQTLITSTSHEQHEAYNLNLKPGERFKSLSLANSNMQKLEHISSFWEAPSD